MAFQNDESSRWFAEHLQPHEEMLRAWLRSRFSTDLDIDDVIQESYFKVLKIKEKGPVNAPKAYLFATARNLAIKALQGKKVFGEVALVKIDECELLDNVENTADIVIRNQELEILTQAIQSLPDRCRQIFTLRKVYGLPQREIATKLGISNRTVNTQLGIAFDKCSKALRKYRKEFLGE